MAFNARLAIGIASIGTLALLGGAAAVGYQRAEALLPPEGRLAQGVKVDGAVVPEGASPEAFVEERAAGYLDRPIELLDGEQVLATTTMRALGGTADVEGATARAMKVARSGSWEERVSEAARARAHGVDVSLSFDLPADAIAEAVAALKEETDKAPHGARRLPDAEGGVTPHEEGRYVDAYATAEAVLLAVRHGEKTAQIAHYRWVPAATSDAARSADVSQVLASFETRYGGPVGRDKNIARATKALNGIVLLPGETVSFNEEVGPRSSDNGFFPAPEIYKGESRLGIGGGSCQVASTLYAAAFFGGLEVMERRNHSRPSGYIRPGLDATVSYPVLDLRIRNNFSFPVVLSAKMEPGKLSFEVLGKERPATVALATETAGILKYSRKLERAALPEGEFKLKQKGKRGLVIKRKKTITLASTGQVTVEEDTDTYPAQQEIYLIGPKTDEGTLPPLEGPDAKIEGV
ncbi:MAG: hypothetical protein HOV80_31225 [Polyangiaceae bacterium]|nr:hypothetical protein [Polyangiaceae bacterium]